MTKLKSIGEMTLEIVALIVMFLQLASFAFLTDIDWGGDGGNKNVEVSIEHIRVLNFYVVLPTYMWQIKFLVVLSFVIFYLVSLGVTKTKKFSKYYKKLEV